MRVKKTVAANIIGNTLVGMKTSSDTSIIENFAMGSLPYIDYLDENYEAYALSLIEEEMQKGLSEPNKLKHLPNIPKKIVNKTPIFESEYKRVYDQNGATQTLSRKRPKPSTALSAPVASLQNDEHAWKLAIRKAKIELESQRSTLCNLEIQQVFESQKWRNHIAMLQINAEKIRLEVNAQKTEVDMINAKRKEKQENEAGTYFHSLSNRYEELLQNIQNYGSATIQLKREIKSMNVEKESKVES